MIKFYPKASNDVHIHRGEQTCIDEKKVVNDREMMKQSAWTITNAKELRDTIYLTNFRSYVFHTDDG